MALYLRGNTWWYSITVKGKTERGSCKTRDEQQAREYHDRLRAEIWRGKVVKDKLKRTAAEAIERFLRERENKRSYKDDQRYGRWWVEQFSAVGVKLLEDVTPDTVAGIRDEELQRITRRGAKVSKATMNRKIAFLRSVVTAAAKEWLWIETAPKFRLLPGETERRRFLTPEEVVRLAKSLPSPYADMAMLAVATGLRQSNVFGLKWSEVSLQHRKIVLPQQVMKNGLPFSCPLNETAISVIRRWVGRHETNVFVRPDGHPVRQIPSKTWSCALEKAGLSDLRWHDLRHTWASLLRQAGVNLSDLKELGGWESSRMVDRYAHLNVEHLAPSAAVMDGVFGVKKAALHEIRTATA